MVKILKGDASKKCHILTRRMRAGVSVESGNHYKKGSVTEKPKE